MNTSTPQSRYQPIWDALKKDKKVRLTAPPILHARIIKAVKKRRDKDLLFQHQLVEDHKKARLRFKTDGSIIEITLNISIGLSEL